MSKVTVNPIGTLIDSTTAQTAINSNFQTVASAFDNTLSLDGTSPNQMQSNFDMNSQQIVNLPAPATLASPLRLQDATNLTNTGTVVLLPTGGTTGQTLSKNTSTNYDVSWQSNASSVGLAMPADFTVTNSPITSTGNLTAAWAVTPTGTGAVVRATSPTLVTPALGTPVSGVLTNCTGLPLASITGLAGGISAFLSTPSSANLATAVTDETGTGALVFANSPALSGVTLTNPVITGTGETFNGSTSGTTILKATAVASGTLTLPATTDTLVGKATTDSLSNKTLVTPILGVATATSINGSTVSPGHYSGEPSNGSPLAGEIGELITAQVLSGSAISLSNGVAANITSISLTAGDWDITGGGQFVNGATTSTTFQGVWLSTTSATFSALMDDGYVAYNGGAFVNYNASYATGVKTLKLSATTTVYISVLSNFTVSTCTAYGKIRARRVR